MFPRNLCSRSSKNSSSVSKLKTRSSNLGSRTSKIETRNLSLDSPFSKTSSIKNRVWSRDCQLTFERHCRSATGRYNTFYLAHTSTYPIPLHPISARLINYTNNLSLSHGVVPVLWKRANVNPVFKKDNPTLAENYRPISLLCIVSKVLERCIFNHCYPHFAPLLYNLQHGFLRGKSTVTQLLEVYHDILDMVAGGQEIDVIHLDLSKAFDKVPHDLLLTKLHRHGISGTALRWFEGYLSNRQQRVVLEGTFSDWLPVTSGVPQGSILGPLLFLVFANEMPSYVQHGSSLALFADDSKLYRPLGSVSSSALLQSDLDGLHSWSSDHRMTFNTTKCKVLRMSKRRSCRKPLNTYYLGEEILSHSPETSDLGISVSGNCTWTSHIEQMCSKANRVLGLVKRPCGRDIRDVQTRKLLYTALVRPLLEYSSSVWSPYFVKHRRLIENIQRRATKFILNYPPREVSYINRLD